MFQLLWKKHRFPDKSIDKVNCSIFLSHQAILPAVRASPADGSAEDELVTPPPKGALDKDHVCMHRWYEDTLCMQCFVSGLPAQVLILC